ncbi:hypothetical protein OCU04_012262 [Sclerotinia nivalis]|uniref:Uncharacterized protein n=1 Tax=Sclerotinia nivalis TaxID=352851 RepID=A0A9X0DFY8_9HELO|nr:hypothetical protein OCU04_012262 [Sclerotinia nivalis]
MRLRQHVEPLKQPDDSFPISSASLDFYNRPTLYHPADPALAVGPDDSPAPPISYPPQFGDFPFFGRPWDLAVVYIPAIFAPVVPWDSPSRSEPPPPPVLPGTFASPFPSATPASPAPSQAREVTKPYVNRDIYCIGRVRLTEIELMNIRDYSSLLDRKTCFKNSPGRQKYIELTMGELQRLRDIRNISAREIAIYEGARAGKQEFRIRSEGFYEEFLLSIIIS